MPKGHVPILNSGITVTQLFERGGELILWDVSIPGLGDLKATASLWELLGVNCEAIPRPSGPFFEYKERLRPSEGASEAAWHYTWRRRRRSWQSAGCLRRHAAPQHHFLRADGRTDGRTEITPRDSRWQTGTKFQDIAQQMLHQM